METFRLLSQNPPALSDRDRLSSARRAQLFENGFDVRLYRSNRQSQLLGNSLVAQPEHHLPQDIRFPCGQRLLLHPVGNARGDQWPQGDATDVHRSQTVDQFLKAAAEQQVAARTLLQRMGDLRLAVTMRQNHHPMARRSRRRDQSQTRLVVRDDEIGWRQVAARRLRYSQIGTTDNRFEVAPLSQSDRESRRYQRVAVRNEHLYSGGLGHCSILAAAT